MDAFKDIVASLEKQKHAIEKALAALLEVGGGAAAAPAKPAKRAYKRRAAKRKGGISEEGRKRLADAMKKRWAVKRAGSTVKRAGRKKAAA